MSKKSKQTFNIEAIKTPDGQIPTVESFHRVVDGLFGEILDTRKDIAKLIPNIEKELSSLREILAQQMVLIEVLNDSMEKLHSNIAKQDKNIAKIQKTTAATDQSSMAQAELTEESKKAITKVIQSEITKSTKPIADTVSALQKELKKSSKSTITKVEKKLADIQDQIDDMSSKSELQMLELLESVNQNPIDRKTKSSSSSSKSSSKKKLSS